MKKGTTRPAGHDALRKRLLRYIRSTRAPREQQTEPKEAESCVCELWGPSQCPRCSTVFGDRA